MIKSITILKILKNNPEIGARVKVIIEGEGSFVYDGSDVTSSDADRDCTIQGTMATFDKIIDGELNPTSAFLSGHLKINGDMAIALQIANLFTNA
ncbi:MAG: SCP2 sterol-binding domain-containing protein [Rhodobacteraceae bacterium]|nr:SCP2 sterol-binding domain-containing protein [Paracoccaceae bacterium]